MTELNWLEIKNNFLLALLTSNQAEAFKITRRLLTAEVSMLEFFQHCITPSLEEIGARFENLEIFLPEMVEAASIVECIEHEILEPEIQKTMLTSTLGGGLLHTGRVLLATVQGDLHDIGKNMVGSMLKVNGFEVIDAGVNVAAQDIISKARSEHVNIIGLSALLTTTLPYMKDVMDLLVGFGLRHKYSVIVGGAAVTPEFAKEIQADGYGRTAVDAVQVCKSILGIGLAGG
jgi:methylmalonyl-CoA mutase cobalamin-binding domain/chain